MQLQVPHLANGRAACSFMHKPVFQELFSHKRLVEDLARSASIDEFFEFLAGVTATGSQLIDLCSRQFMARNGLGGLSAGDGVPPSEITMCASELNAHMDRFTCIGAVEEFVAYVRRFFEAFPCIAAYDLGNPVCQKVNDESLARTLHYLSFLGLFRQSGKNIVEFCASNQLFSFIAGLAGHKAISTDMGGVTAEEVYGFGAKIFLRNAVLGSNVANFHLDRNDFTAACAVPWFKDGLDVIATHGTFINVGRKVDANSGPAEMMNSLAEVMTFLRPCVQVLRPRQGTLSLRHVVLFDGYGTDAKFELSGMLRTRIEQEFEAKTLLCGEDPFPSPWAQAHGGQFTYALVIRC
jgi:hypothetical protein